MRKLVILGAALLLAGVAEAEPARYFKQLWYGAAGDTTAQYLADSTAILATANTGRLYLWLKPDRPCRVAIQIRAHGTADTAGASIRDTTQTASWPWRMHTTSAAAGGLSNQTDSTSWNEIQGLPASPGTQFTAWEDEYVVQFSADAVATTAKAWQGPRAKWIPLVTPEGAPFWAPATSIRVRVLASAGGAVVKWVGALHGAPW